MQKRWLGLLGMAVGALGFSVAGCGTDAVGVSECRAIERARCEAAVACGYPDAEECRRLQRDQCLHGVAVVSISSVEADACVRDIQNAGSCAASLGSTTAASACMPAVATDLATRTACDVVLSPEVAGGCAFLAPADASAPEAPAAPAAPTLDAGT